MTTMADAYAWQGREVQGSDGEKIGSIMRAVSEEDCKEQIEAEDDHR